MKILKYSELKNYRRNLSEIDDKYFNTAAEIIGNVRKNGDKVLVEYARKYDRVQPENFSLFVTDEEREKAADIVKKEYKDIFEYFINASSNIREYHRRQKEESWFYTKEGNLYGQMVKPLEKVGVYVPGGRAFYPSTVLMNIIPAKIAGVKEITLSTPPDEKGGCNPFLIALADSLGADKILKAGGAQAIAALAFGTETIEPVSKITGPGNIYVAAAKRLVMGQVGIDSIAGPSEVVVFADDSAEPDWLAADLCAQAEHDSDATAILISNSKDLIAKVNDELNKMIPQLTRKEIIEKSINENAMAVITDDYDQGFELINRLAPEHAEIQINVDTKEILGKIYNAGGPFIGRWTPVAAGDYYAGTNHVLPTYGTAVFSSPLGVYDFIKRTSFLSLSENYIKAKGPEIEKMAEFENLTAHALSVKKRL